LTSLHFEVFKDLKDFMEIQDDVITCTIDEDDVMRFKTGAVLKSVCRRICIYYIRGHSVDGRDQLSIPWETIKENIVISLYKMLLQFETLSSKSIMSLMVYPGIIDCTSSMFSTVGCMDIKRKT
jgi:hypothetical protein